MVGGLEAVDALACLLHAALVAGLAVLVVVLLAALQHILELEQYGVAIVQLLRRLEAPYQLISRIEAVLQLSGQLDKALEKGLRLGDILAERIVQMLQGIDALTELLGTLRVFILTDTTTRLDGALNIRFDFRECAIDLLRKTNCISSKFNGLKIL